MASIRAILETALVTAAIAGFPMTAAAQQLRLELKGGAAVGNFTEAEAGLELAPGPSFGALGELWLTETAAVYLGLSRSSFGCDEGFCTGRDVSLTSQGLVAGGRWSPGLPWVRAGLALRTLDVRATGADERSDPGVGIELAAGLGFAVWDRLRIRPGLTYLRHAASTGPGSGHVTLVALEIGASVDLYAF